MTKRLSWLRALAIAGILALIAAIGAPNSSSAQTIDDIIKRGKIIVGVNTTTPIFGLMGRTDSPRAMIRMWRASLANISACKWSSCRSQVRTASLIS
jgi:hypothetical protein